MKSNQKIVCIGLNHAGVSALKTLVAKSSDLKLSNLKINAYEQDDNVAFLSCGIALWIKKEIDQTKKLFQTTVKDLQDLGINVFLKHRVIQVDSKKKRVLIKNLRTNTFFWDSYDKLILSTGSRLCRPNWNGIDLKGVFLAKNFQEGKTLIDFLQQKNVKKVAVIGTGYVGIEFAEAFVQNKKKVFMFDISPRVMFNYFESEFTQPIEKEIKKQNVNLFLDTRILGFSGQNGHVRKIITNKGEHEIDMVVVCVGAIPNTELFIDILTLTNDKFIQVNRFFQTSEPDIYACGDCVKIFDNSCQRERNLGLASNSIRTGISLSLNLLTNNKYPFCGVQATSAVNVFGWKVLSTGINSELANKLNLKHKTTFFEDFSRPNFMISEKVKIKLCWNPETRNILGCQIASREDHSEIIYFFSLAILKKLKIDELAMVDLFFLPHFNKPDNFITQVGLRALGLEISGL